jgi:glycosidase
MRLYRLLILLLISVFGQMKTNFGQPATPFNAPPDWAKYAIWYQIFPERFYNGDPKNDPDTLSIKIEPVGMIPPAGWTLTHWTNDWYSMEDWAKKSGKSFGEMSQYRRYGGDLQGIISKLDYLTTLGINAIYFNPLNDAPSLHKYDARHYHHIDVNLGPDPAGDRKIIASEKFNDPATWKWTSADKLFLKLIKECKKRGIRIIMDYSWNHTGVLFPAWQDLLKNQQKSEYRDWYEIKSWDDPTTSANEFSYQGWAGVDNLPELKKTGLTAPRKSGYPHDGNIKEEVKQHIFAVSQRWLAPDGDKTAGIDGFRLDVADQIGLDFWREFRKFVRGIQPDAYLVGEIWWAEWPEKLMDPLPYVQGDIFDAVMFYQVYKPARYFFAKTNFPLTAAQFRDSLEFQWKRLPEENLCAMMNTASSHDAPRLLTDFYNPNKYKFKSTPNDDPEYKTGKPDPVTYRRLRLYLMHIFTTIGAPHIWNGEEMGMWGADDPHCRKPLWWQEFTFEPENRNNFQLAKAASDPVGFNQAQFSLYQKLIRIRKENPVLATGKTEFLISEGKKLVYKRFDDKNQILVCFNLDHSPQTFNLPSGTTAIDLMNGRKQKNDTLRLGPYTGAILKLVTDQTPGK